MLPSLFSENGGTVPMTPDLGEPIGQPIQNKVDGPATSQIRRTLRGQRPGRVRLVYLDTGSSTSGAESEDEAEGDSEGDREDEGDSEGENESERDSESARSPEKEEPLAATQPEHTREKSNFLERYRHENKWLELKKKPMPNTEPDLNQWADEWLNAYEEGVRLQIPRFVSDGSRMALLDFLTAIECPKSAVFATVFLNYHRAIVEQDDQSAVSHLGVLIREFIPILLEDLNYSPNSFRSDHSRKLSGWNDLMSRDSSDHSFFPPVRSDSFGWDFSSILSTESEAKTVTGSQDEGEDEDEEKNMDQFNKDWNSVYYRICPSGKIPLQIWIEDWRLLYKRGVALKHPIFIQDDGKAFIDYFLEIIRESEGFTLFSTVLQIHVEEADTVPSFDSVLDQFELYPKLERKRRELEEEAKKAAEAAKVAEAAKKKQCICGFKNHQVWKECFYLNETIRPAGWVPKMKIMARITEQAQHEKSIRNFIKNHKLKPVPPPETEEPEKREEEEEEEIQGPFQVPFPPLSGEKALEPPEEIKTSFIVSRSSPIHICNDRSRFVTFEQRDPTLPENRIYCRDPFETVLRIHGIGEIDVCVTTPAYDIGRNYKRELSQVRYCPKAPWNVLSPGENLDEERFVFSFWQEDQEEEEKEEEEEEQEEEEEEHRNIAPRTAYMFGFRTIIS